MKHLMSSLFVAWFVFYTVDQSSNVFARSSGTGVEALKIIDNLEEQGFIARFVLKVNDLFGIEKFSIVPPPVVRVKTLQSDGTVSSK